MHHNCYTLGEPPEDADFSGVQMNIGAAKKMEMRERLKAKCRSDILKLKFSGTGLTNIFFLIKQTKTQFSCCDVNS